MALSENISIFSDWMVESPKTGDPVLFFAVYDTGDDSYHLCVAQTTQVSGSVTSLVTVSSNSYVRDTRSSEVIGRITCSSYDESGPEKHGMRFIKELSFLFDKIPELEAEEAMKMRLALSPSNCSIPFIWFETALFKKLSQVYLDHGLI